MSKTQKVKLSDYYRVLLSETAPFDVPLIFSNNHFYSRMRSYKDSEPEVKLLIERIFTRTIDTSYCPIKYPILKGEDSCRYLSLLHPASQLHIVELYKKYSDRLLHHCSVGSFSIRRPKKVASTVSVKSSISDSRAFRSDAASTVSDEKKFKHSTSYFSYSPHTKLHQFFGSPEYFKLESKFTHFWSIDISKCFDSIYTHSITWAVKGKKFSKTTSSDTDFTNILDRIMQSSNYNETNGIVIGNEFSRIFAEIILQDVDEKVENLASSEGLTAGKDYEIKRYVDDYFIFCSSEGLARKIVAILEECLRAYKFHLNTSKTKKRSRPLITGITRAKIKTDEAIKEIFQIIFSIEDSEKFITKSLIRDPNAVSRKFLNLIMNASYEDSEAYLTMCGYVISSIFNALKTLNYREDDEDSEH
ncbi:antiviral reverse transcriptase Drt3b [Rheinheimera texasensis]|uniref:antiviral reverse transcriptase Drt3b n=1 Tax=Rheinheimera texasensis TaxID=306205 RepID=UPI0032B25D90